MYHLPVLIKLTLSRPYLFLLQMSQLPLIALGRLPIVKRNKVAGNGKFLIRSDLHILTLPSDILDRAFLRVPPVMRCLLRLLISIHHTWLMSGFPLLTAPIELRIIDS